MKLEVHPCPFCGGVDTKIAGDVGGFYAECVSSTSDGNRCLAFGPTKSTADEAVETWNRVSAGNVKSNPKLTPIYAIRILQDDASLLIPDQEDLGYVGSDYQGQKSYTDGPCLRKRIKEYEEAGKIVVAVHYGWKERGFHNGEVVNQLFYKTPID